MQHSACHAAYFGLHDPTDVRAYTHLQFLGDRLYKNSSGDEIANVNFYAVRPEATRIRWNNTK